MKLLISLTFILQLALSAEQHFHANKTKNIHQKAYNYTDSLSTQFRRLLLVLAAKEYNNYLLKNSIVDPDTNRDAQMVKRVGKRLGFALTQYFKELGQDNLVDDFSWDYNLVNDSSVTSWTMPGAKAVVNTGFLKQSENEAALAAILAHQIAHLVSKHKFAEIELLIKEKFKGEDINATFINHKYEIQQLLNEIYCNNSTKNKFQYSLEEELDADRKGLMYTALTGYNPRETVHVWNRLFDYHKTTPLSLISEHPFSETRREKIISFMPEALKYYKPLGR